MKVTVYRRSAKERHVPVCVFGRSGVDLEVFWQSLDVFNSVDFPVDG